MKYDTIMDATYAWVQTFNAFQYGMMERLAGDEYSEFEEITPPSKYDRVYFWNAETENGEPAEVDDGDGEIVGKDGDRYIIEPDNDEGEGRVYSADVDVLRDGFFPMWGTMWQFGDSCDDWWLEENLQTMADCGFRIYQHVGEDGWGYFFGIDGAGYDFYEAHWIPLYKARGLQWHKAEEKSA